jgi:hypothetical protein
MKNYSLVQLIVICGYIYIIKKSSIKIEDYQKVDFFEPHNGNYILSTI